MPFNVICQQAYEQIRFNALALLWGIAKTLNIHYSDSLKAFSTQLMPHVMTLNSLD